MFAYCNNSPVAFSDGSGQRMVYAPVVDGGPADDLTVCGSSDNQEMSGTLLDEIVDNISSSSTKGIVQVRVEYEGIYSKKTDKLGELLVDGALTLGGGFLTSIPVAGPYLAAAASAYGGWAFFNDVIEYINPELPDKDYHMYTATITWDSKSHIEGQNKSYEYCYLWNDVSYTSPYWHLQSIKPVG